MVASINRPYKADHIKPTIESRARLALTRRGLYETTVGITKVWKHIISSLIFARPTRACLRLSSKDVIQMSIYMINVHQKSNVLGLVI